MADTVLSDLTATTTLASGDLLYVVDEGNSRKIDYADVVTQLAAATKTLTNTTLDANGTGNSISNIEVADLASAAKTGADAKVVTGTAGTDGNLVSWNADGDAVDSGSAPSDFATAAQGALADSAIQSTDTASDTAAGIVELATAAETTTGTDTGRAVTPDGLAGSIFGTQVVQLLVFDDSQDVATGDGAGDLFFRVPSTMNGMNLIAVAACVQTAGTTGTTDIQIHNVTDTADMLSTVITIDSGETDSSTAATAAVINAATDDVVSTTAPKGLLVELQFRLP